MKALNFFRLLLVALSLALAGGVAQAQDRNAAVARMDQRLSAVDSLKERKVVGENNRGLLEARSSLSPADSQLVAEENADRNTVYASIAAQTGTTPDQVGRARAQKIASASRPGLWIQTPDGSWVEKQ